ncbi:unnamed protein product [Darwinula stevensoni]|uniref:Uncharacterized protein n=1 Tax=Darwinula stevensoni TaxID=69355 RepID=A0A7R9FT98_9CRUS|nr:unnamed protein product [Darwinula stevensoni]CAG0905669.1 unnamed protein product [Darwinula stevensoni]
MRVDLRENTTISLFLNPEVIQTLSKKDDPCIHDDNHSYMRCMENCFWMRFQSNPNVSCIIPSLMTEEVNLMKPACGNREDEHNFLMRLVVAQSIDVPRMRPTDCNCPKRCNVIDYRISADPNPTCQLEMGDANIGGATIYINFPSKRIPYILEKEKVTLQDLLSNIGGIVGVCLGISLITIFDIIDQICYSVRSKILSRRNRIIKDDEH